MRQDKAVVITGAGSGLGRALALHYAQQGWAVAALDISEDDARATAEAVTAAGGQAIYQAADVREAEAMEDAASRTAAHFGAFHAWINNAGIATAGTVEDAPLDQWQSIIDINLLGVVRGCRAAIPWLKRAGGGHIANVASFAAIANPPGMASYNVVKSAVVSLSETLRLELAGDGIHVVAACPSFFKTNLIASSRKLAGGDTAQPRQTMEKVTEKLMAKSRFTAEDVAAAMYRAAERGQFLVVMRPDLPLWLTKRASPELFFRMVQRSTRKFIDRR